MISELRRKALPFQEVLRRMTWSIQSCMLGLKGIGFYSSLTSSNCKKKRCQMAIFISGDASHEKNPKLTMKKVRPKGQNKTHLFILKKNPDPERKVKRCNIKPIGPDF